MAIVDASCVARRCVRVRYDVGGDAVRFARAFVRACACETASATRARVRRRLT
jgi:hypothetical protein